MTNGKAKIQIALEAGNMAVTWTGCGMNDAITLLEAAKIKILLQAMGGPGRPAEPGAPQGASYRSPGLQVRRADSVG